MKSLFSPTNRKCNVVKLRSFQIHKPDGSVDSFAIHQQVVNIGRAANNDLILADPECSVSRWHARLVCLPDASATLTDLNSVNGTLINGQPVNAPVPVQPNDNIAIGKFRLLFCEDVPAPWQWEIQTGAVELNELQRQTHLIKGKTDNELITNADLAHLDLLHEVGISLARTQSVADVMQVAVEMLFKIGQVHRATIMLWNESQQTFESADLHLRSGKTVDPASAPFNPQQLVMSRTILNQVRQENKPLLLRDATSEVLLRSADSIIGAGIQTAFCSPLTYQERFLGVLYADNLIDPNAFSDTDFRVFTTVAAQAGLALAHAQSREELWRREIERRALKLYLPSQVAELLNTPDGGYQLGGALQPVTVLFADIRGFTRVAEQMDAGKVVLMLNQFFTAMSAIIIKHGGVLDKFIGDCVMALFGAPVPDEGAVQQGFEAAIEMQQEVKRLNVSRMNQEFPEIQIGIGLHTGPAVVGNIGSADRVQYTAIGDTVNVAARLVDLAAGDQVIVSEDIHTALRDCNRFEYLGPFELRGRRRSVNIYSARWGEQIAVTDAARRG